MPENTKTFTITTTVTLPDQLLEDALDAAFAGGSGYWIKRVEVVKPLPPPVCGNGCGTPPAFQRGYGWVCHACQAKIAEPATLAEVCMRGGTIRVHADDYVPACGVKLIDRDVCIAGATKMAADPKWSRCWRNVATENSDADDGDVLLQFIALGEVVFS